MKYKTLFSTKVLLKNSFDHSLHFKSSRHSTFNPTIFLSKRVVIPTERCHYLYRKVSSFIKEGTSNGKVSLPLLKDAFIPMERRRYLYQKGSLFLPEEIFVPTEKCLWFPAFSSIRFSFTDENVKAKSQVYQLSKSRPSNHFYY